MSPARRAVLALGSNLGEREEHLDRALRALRGRSRILATSRVHETAPVGGPPQGRFLNMVVLVAWEGTPEELLVFAQSLEAEAGRERSVRWGPRTLDVDLLLFGDQSISGPELTLPHPRLHERAFVLIPLAEVAPDWIVPGLGRSVRDLLEDLALPR